MSPEMTRLVQELHDTGVLQILGAMAVGILLFSGEGALLRLKRNIRNRRMKSSELKQRSPRDRK